MPQNTTRPATGKPAKPHRDFPLFPHATGRWAKKIRGRFVYFGPWADPQAALAKWLEQKDDLLAGRVPRSHGEGLTLQDFCNRYLTHKKAARDAGELSPRTWQDYFDACELVVEAFGKKRLLADLCPEDFEQLRRKMTKKWGPVRVGNVIQYIRTAFRYALNSEWIDRPVRFGPGFKRPSRKTLRKVRHAKGSRMFEAADLRRVIAAAGTQLKAMILLGINAGCGNADIGRLEFRHLDLEGGWLNYPRSKTEVPRRVPLWPETVAAIRTVIEERPAPKVEADAQRVFITKYGLPWFKDTPDSPVTKEFAKLLQDLELKRPGLSFYALRHTTQTIGERAKDHVAINAIMGHVDQSMSDPYREGIEDESLLAVTNHIHHWLFPPEESKTEAEADTKTPAKRPPRKKPKQPR